MNKMTKTAISFALAAIISGCSSALDAEINWNKTDSSTQIEITDTNEVSTTSLIKSAVWLNRMPTIGEQSDPLLHASLILQSDTAIPSDLAIETLFLRQLDNEWAISGDEVEIHVENENVWQLKVGYPLDVDPEEKIDIAIELSSQNKVYWLSNTAVNVDVTH